MKFDCGLPFRERRAERERRKRDWHRFFALFPRRVGPHDCRWLEYIERKGKSRTVFHFDPEIKETYPVTVWENEYWAIRPQ